MCKLVSAGFPPKLPRLLNSNRVKSKKTFAKGTTDPRVEFISQDHSSQIFTKSQPNISISNKSKFKILTKPSFEYWPRFNLVISTKLQQQNSDQTSASKSHLNFNFKILTKMLKVWTKVKLYDQISASNSATNCCQHNPHHQHQHQ